MSNRHAPAVHAAEFETLSRAAVKEFAPESDLGAMAVVMNLLRAANRLQQDFDTKVHRPVGLTFAAFRMMFAIRALGRLNPLEIARLSSVSAASASSMVNTLERKGLVVRRKEGTQDGRMVLVELTPEGEDLLSALWQRNHEREIEWASVLSDNEQKTLVRLLRKLIAYHASPADATQARAVRDPSRAP
jgi:DNA-binding MarR family transcriptional regulator